MTFRLLSARRGAGCLRCVAASRRRRAGRAADIPPAQREEIEGIIHDY